MAAFILYEIRSAALDQVLLSENARDYARFVAMLGLSPEPQVRSGVLYGPVLFPENPELKYCIGKAVRVLS